MKIGVILVEENLLSNIWKYSSLTILEGPCRTYSKLEFYFLNAYDSSLVVADINEDNKIDIIFIYYSTKQLYVVINSGNGIFTDRKIYLTDLGPSSLEIGDINKDGKLDIIVANQYSDSISIFYNTGHGMFNKQAII
jgi:hypothetical protein